MSKTTDYGGAGLNRGYSMHLKAPKPDGVVWENNCKKWLVRIKKNGQICTMCGFYDKQKAQEQYEILLTQYKK